MIISWAPHTREVRDANGTVVGVVTACEAVLAMMHARPKPTPEFVQAHLVFLVVVLVLVVVFIPVWWWAGRRYMMIAVRENAANYCVTASLVLVMLGGPTFRYGFVSVSGYPDLQSCVLIPTLYLFSIQLTLAGMYFRLYVATQKARQQKLARQFEAVGGGRDASVSDSSSDRPQGHEKQAWRLKRVVDDLLLRSGAAPATAPPPSPTALSSVIQAGAIPTFNDMVESRESMSYQTMASMFLIMCLPVGLLILILCLVVEPYRTGCTGCEMHWEVLISIIIVSTLASFFTIRAEVALKSEKDPFHVIRELMITSAFSAPFMALGTILNIVDPFYLASDFVFDFEILVQATVFMIWLLWTPGLILVAMVSDYRSRLVQEAQARAHENSVSKYTIRALEEHLDDPDFVEMCERRFVVESLRFMTDVRAWKTLFFDKGSKWAKLKAKLLVDTYVRVSSPLQLNVSEELRQDVERKLRAALASDSAPIPFELFDHVYLDVGNMIANGAFAAFLDHKRRVLASRPMSSSRTTLSVALTPLAGGGRGRKSLGPTSSTTAKAVRVSAGV